MSANYLRKHLFAASLLALGVFAITPSLQPVAAAQTNISGDLAGTVTDPSGAAIAGASVTVTSKATGSTKTITSGGHGEYRVPLLQPGDYSVAVSAAGFEGAKTTITVGPNQVASGDVKLAVGKATTVVDVAATEPLLHTEDAQISTSFSMEQVQALPNPGNDLTFVAQTSPGAVMNTQGGYGNFSVFGLPATSNTFTVNGGYENDPFLNLNNSGATNLLLGNNDVADVTVTSNAYDAAFGGLGGAQINEISRSGSNGFHGNATYWWNGRAMNANDWFHNDNGDPRPFDNVNQWAAAIGGPIKKDKAFWFVNYEGLRVVLPTTSPVYAPSPSDIADITSGTPIIGTAPDGNVFPFGNLAYQGNSAEAANETATLNQWTNAPGYKPTNFVASPGWGPQQFVTYQATAGNFTHEYLVSGRTDFNLGQNDKMFVHFEVDKGLQATFTSLLNPIFNADSPQPQYQGQLSETHTFTPNLTNQFLFGALYYRAIFTNTNLAAANAITPFSLAAVLDSPVDQDGLGGLPGGEDFVWPQGRNVTNYQFQDDLSWTRGNHTIKVGYSLRRDDVSDFDVDPLSISAEAVETWESFQAGNVDEWVQAFPANFSEPIALYSEGFYAQDQWKALSNLTLTFGMRFEHNSNPVCVTNCFGDSNGDFFKLPTSTSTPLNQLIASGQHAAFPNLQKIGYEPRIGFAWLPGGPGSRTTVRGGFGMFTDVFPATVADSLLSNPLTSVVTAVVGPAFTGACDPTTPGCGYGIFPTAPNSATAAAAGIANGIKAGFNSGATAAMVGAPNLTTAAQTVKYPTYEEYSLAVERQLTRNMALSVSYVGNHGYHEPVVNGSANGYSSTGTLPGAPTAPANPNFGGVTIDYAGATSNYNGLITSLVHRQRYLTLQLNYAYSHALDEISNGGFLPFGGNTEAVINPQNLSQQYGNADYDTRHYISGSYVFNIPHWGGPRVLVDNWEIAGTVFHNDGYPYSVTDGSAAGNFGLVNYSSPLAMQTGTSFGTHCGGSAHALPSNNAIAMGAPGTPCSFAANFAPASGYGQQGRNQLSGSSFTDADMDVTKGFKIPGLESGNLKLGAQFFNLFNHPNFGQPFHDVTDQYIGEIPGLQGTPTSILGAFLGGDSSPRLIQLKASFVF
jgi:hypothetical protein